MIDNWFMDTLFKKGYENTLNELWGKDFIRYDEQVRKIKKDGYKIYRNSEGKHKVVVRND